MCLEIYIYEQTQLIDTKKDQRWRESILHSKLEALGWAMEIMLHHSTCQYFGTDYTNVIPMIKKSQTWPTFSTELKEIQELQA